MIALPKSSALVQPSSFSPLHQALREKLAVLNATLNDHPAHPANRMAERLLERCHRALEGEPLLPIHLEGAKLDREAFYGGMEPLAQDRLDLCTGEDKDFGQVFVQRREGLWAHLQRILDSEEYRPSAELCDRAMLEVARFSRFLGVWACACTQRKAGSFAENPHQAMILWEPYCNEALSAWEENHLNRFLKALHTLQELLCAPVESWASWYCAQEYPFRRRGQRRWRVQSDVPQQRSLRSRFRFLSLQQRLVERSEQCGTAEQNTQAAVVSELQHFQRMLQQNHFQIAEILHTQPHEHPGAPVIRAYATQHPLLLDAKRFYKRALLFYNRFFTFQSGADDVFALRLWQLQRSLRAQEQSQEHQFHILERCLLAWEENRRCTFHACMLELAAHLADEPLPQSLRTL